MKTLRVLSIVLSFSVSATVPAMAGVNVSSPSTGDQVSSPFKLSAWATSCSSHNVTAMGYSFDSSSDTTIIDGQSIDTSIHGPSGHHTLHIKAWADGRGAVDRLFAFVEIHIVMPPARFRHLDKQGVSALRSSCPSLKQGLVRSSTQNRRSPSGGMKPKLNLWLLSSATKIGSSMSEAMQYQTIANSSGVILRMRKSEIETDRLAQDLRERRDLYRLVGGIAVGLSVSPLPIGMCNARE